MRTASSSAPSTPTSASLRRISMAESPASIRILLPPASTRIEFPLLPLASRQTRTPPPLISTHALGTASEHRHPSIRQIIFIQESGGRFKAKLGKRLLEQVHVIKGCIADKRVEGEQDMEC